MANLHHIVLKVSGLPLFYIMKKFNFYKRGQNLIRMIIVLIVAGLITSGLFYYFSKQTLEVLEIPEKSAKEIVPPEKKIEERPTLSKEKKPIVQKCIDGTPYGECSTNKPKYCENGSLIDKASLCGCPLSYEISDNQCIKSVKTKGVVLLVIEEYLYKDSEIKTRIERYKESNKEYEFKEILFNKTNDRITSMEDIGGEVKHNSLELRNTIKKLYQSNRNIVGVWLIGNIRPTIWRDKNLWRDLPESGFYPSIYPLIALDEDNYYAFDVENDGFYEKSGATRGSEIGGGYSATIWGAVLIPPTSDKQKAKELIKDYFDRNHAYRVNSLKYEKKLLYSDIFGCSTGMIQKIKNTQSWETVFLCPNFHPQLMGFDSLYEITIYQHHPGGPIEAKTDEEKEEFENLISKDYFGNSKLKAGGFTPYMYSLFLHLEGRSLPSEEIKNKIEKNLPQKICSRLGNCKVHVEEFGFVEKDGTWNGYWTSYPTQQANWKLLYDNLLSQNNFEITYLQTHGTPTTHLFGIDSETIKNKNYSSMIYEIQACNAGNYLENNYLAGVYLFYGNALAVSAYSIPFVAQGIRGFLEGEHSARFLKIQKGIPIIEALFLKNYGNSLYFGDPLLKLPY